MTHSRARHCKQWPIHQDELDESPTAWEDLFREGCRGTYLCSEVLCPPPVAETYWNQLPVFICPAHPATAISRFPQQNMSICGHRAMSHVMAMVGSDATRVLCQESLWQERCPGVVVQKPVGDLSQPDADPVQILTSAKAYRPSWLLYSL
ncbi:hypothetical protein HGM15179_009424 [Zosterops borbonicus]|uniref:Uncharacterized protein n=1 Tax=Zosterops borbonicus TaxID=364589 RepID=A0A8K1GFA4_9PASS|nr:hypothetical protein HGM15179_009424 [Zosterops borbonicus]